MPMWPSLYPAQTLRNGEGMLVSGNTQIEAGDSVVVFCYNVDMKKVEKLFM